MNRDAMETVTQTASDYARDVTAYLGQPNLSKPPTCATCEHWKRAFPENQQLGVCSAGAIFIIDPQNAGTIRVKPHRPKLPEDLTLRTRASFGCNKHSNFIQNQLSE